MRFATSTLPRYHHATSTGGAYGYQLNEKSCRVAAFNQWTNKVRAVASTGGHTSGLVSSEAGRLIFAMSSRIPNPSALGKLTFSNPSLTSVTQPNICAKISWTFSRKSSTIMVLANSVNEKRESDASHIAPRTSQRPIQEERMSFTHLVYHASPRSCHENPLNVGGVS